MAVQVIGHLHVFPDPHRLPHQRSNTRGHSSEQEAPPTSQLHPGELGGGWTDHGLLWIHGLHLFLHGGLFLSGTPGLYNRGIHGNTWR